MHKGNTPGRGGFPACGWVEEGALHHKNCSVEVKIIQYPCDLAPLPAGHRIPVGGWVYCRERSRTPTTHQQGTGSLLVGGFTLGSAPAPHPPISRAQDPCWRVGLLSGACAQGSRPHPPTSREPTPARGVALVHGGQRPITPQS